MIYYIQSEGKQGHLHSLHSASPHRYLRYISWVSWIRRPQAAKVSTRRKLGARLAPTKGAARNFSVAAIQYLRPPLTPQDRSILFCSSLFRNKPLCSSPRKRKNNLLPFPCAALPRCFRGWSVAACSPASAALPQTKKCGPAAVAANPLTTFIKRAQKA